MKKKRLIIGIDLSLTSKNIASIYSPQDDCYCGKPISFYNSYDGYNYLLKKCETFIDEDTQLEFVMEPTGLAWMPLSCYLIKKGYKVYRVSTQKSSDFRKFLNKYFKSDNIDSKALAKIPIIASDKIYEIYLPKTDLGVLGRKVKYLNKLVQEITSHKQRILSSFDMLNPGVLTIFSDNKFTEMGRIFLKYFSNPNKVVEMGKENFIQKFQKLSNKVVDNIKLERIYEISCSTISIYKPMIIENSLPFDFEEESNMIRDELDIIEYIETIADKIEKEIQSLYNKIDNNNDLRSIQGIGIKIAPAILGIIGDVTRFDNIKKFKKYCGYISKKSQSSEKDKKGLKIDKAAQSLLKSSLYMAAETARKWDVEFANFYNRLSKKGIHHIGAISALSNKMAGRIYTVLKRMLLSNSNYAKYCNNTNMNLIKSDIVQYQMKDLGGNVISKKEARDIILEKYPGKSKKKKTSSTFYSNETKQSLNKLNKDSSNRVCRTRHITDILNDMFNLNFDQDNNLESDKKKIVESLKKLKESIVQIDEDNLLVKCGEKVEK